MLAVDDEKRVAIVQDGLVLDERASLAYRANDGQFRFTVTNPVIARFRRPK
jgi:hypothetical protein